MLFNSQSNVSGHLFKVSDDVLLEGNRLWVGCVHIDEADMIVASARLRLKRDRLDVETLDGFFLALGTTDPACGGLGYYAEIVPTSPFPGSEMRGYLKHYDQELDDVFEVRGVYATNADGTSRLDVSIARVD